MSSLVFHSTVILIFGPYIQKSSTVRLPSFYSSDSTVKAVFQASLNQLKDLLIVCTLEHRSLLNSMFINTAIVHVSSAMLSESADPSWREWFLICMKMYQDLYVCYPLFLNVIQGYMSMALKVGALTTQEAAEIIEATKARGRHHQDINAPIALFTIDFE